MELLAEKIIKWAKTNDWYSQTVETNQLRFEQMFEPIFTQIKSELDYQGKVQIKGQLESSCGKAFSRCRHVDTVCRAGCRDQSDLFDLEFSRAKAVAAMVELAEVVKVIGKLSVQNKLDDCSSINPSDEWITFKEAAVILGVSKPAVSKWANRELIEDNGKTGQARRLKLSSVLLMKNQREEEPLKKDILDLRRDLIGIRD